MTDARAFPQNLFRAVAAAVATLLCCSNAATADPLVQSLHFDTRARWESAVAVKSPVDQKLDVLIEPRIEADLAGGFQVTAIGRLRADPANELRPDNPKEHELWKPTRSARLGDYTQLSLRELYVERRLGPAHLILGKQQAVWGTSDGLKVLDIVNPQDFREFILEDYVDSRIPTWMANVTFPLGMFQTQLRQSARA